MLQTICQLRAGDAGEGCAIADNEWRQAAAAGAANGLKSPAALLHLIGKRGCTFDVTSRAQTNSSCVSRIWGEVEEVIKGGDPEDTARRKAQFPRDHLENRIAGLRAALR